ncbi:MAG: hypothetical protein ACOC2W_02530 [bacterium]
MNKLGYNINKYVDKHIPKLEKLFTVIGDIILGIFIVAVGIILVLTSLYCLGQIVSGWF